jgi:hypothetical protein
MGPAGYARGGEAGGTGPYSYLGDGNGRRTPPLVLCNSVIAMRRILRRVASALRSGFSSGSSEAARLGRRRTTCRTETH